MHILRQILRGLRAILRGIVHVWNVVGYVREDSSFTVTLSFRLDSSESNWRVHLSFFVWRTTTYSLSLRNSCISSAITAIR